MSSDEILTPENAPLFLVLEVTKKTMKLVYVDTPDMLSEKIFREQGLKVKILNVGESGDPRYQFVGCRISGRDIDLFRGCIEDLERRLLLTGHRDYREACLTELVRLIERSGYQPEDVAEEVQEQEYPKSMLIPFIPQGSLEDVLMAYYALIRTNTNRPEVAVFHKDVKQDPFALILRNDNSSAITYNIFRKTYLSNKNGITATTSLDDEDQERVNILLLPEEVYANQGLSVDPIVTVYNMETEAKLAGFFKEWDEKYQEVRKEM